MYFGVGVILLTAITHGASPHRVTALRAQLGVDRRTLVRWQVWWREHFPDSRFWREQRARLSPVLCDEGLPGTLLDRFAPQGGVVSPLLANVYLHEVLDQVTPSLQPGPDEVGALRQLAEALSTSPASGGSLGVSFGSESMSRGAVCGSPARTDLWDPGVSNCPGRPGGQAPAEARGACGTFG